MYQEDESVHIDNISFMLVYVHPHDENFPLISKLIKTKKYFSKQKSYFFCNAIKSYCVLVPMTGLMVVLAIWQK
jgi:hypothetical protein